MPFSPKNAKSERRLEQNLAKNLPFVIGLAEKEPKERKVAGLIVTLPMAKVAINLVAAQPEKKERNIPHVDQHRVPVKSEAKERVGARKQRNGVKRNEINNRTIKKNY